MLYWVTIFSLLSPRWLIEGYWVRPLTLTKHGKIVASQFSKKFASSSKKEGKFILQLIESNLACQTPADCQSGSTRWSSSGPTVPWHHTALLSHCLGSPIHQLHSHHVQISRLDIWIDKIFSFSILRWQIFTLFLSVWIPSFFVTTDVTQNTDHWSHLTKPFIFSLLFRIVRPTCPSLW